MTEDLAAQVRALLDDDLSRGALKRLARDLDADPGLRDAVLAEATRRGNPLPEDASSWPGKRILRRARARDVEAMERLKALMKDPKFIERGITALDKMMAHVSQSRHNAVHAVEDAKEACKWLDQEIDQYQPKLDLLLLYLQ